ncbi:hypothetical protein F4680DRAFT_419639 [Xylaria scruposa]|nr:hypothetical protein F4680DRAFT_419639 [Xylaria scruposa]
MRFMLSFLPAFLLGRNEAPYPDTSSDAIQTTIDNQPADICSTTTRVEDTEQRTEFFSRYSRVKAYPSVGGVVIGRSTAVQLKQLGLSNIKPAPRSHNETEEDELALGLMRQGAHWWPSWQFYMHHYDRLDARRPVCFHYPPRIYVGYPSSGNGVWVSKFTEDGVWVPRPTAIGYAENDFVNAYYLEFMWEDLEVYASMALNEDERCEVLKSFGAKFYDTVEECEDIPKTLDEGVQRGKRYEELLNKMDDIDYRKRWSEGMWRGDIDLQPSCNADFI